MAEEQRRDKGARFLLIAASLVVVIAGMKLASSLILPFLTSIFIAMITLPLLNWLQANKISTPVAVLVTVFVAVSVLVGIVYVVGGSIQDFTQEAPKYKERLEVMFSETLAWIQARGINVSEQITSDLIDPSSAMDMITGGMRAVAAVLSNVVLVFLTIIFILFEAAGFPAKLQAAFGKRESSERFAKIRWEIQRYLGIKSLVSLATGVLIASAMAIIGVDFPLLWGGLAFLLNYIPTLGSIIAAVPPTLLAMIQLGPGHAIGVAVIFATVNITLGNLVEPYFMGRRLGLSTLVVFLSLVFWGWVWGPVGMLLSVPLTMILKIMLENTEDLRWAAVLLSAGTRTEKAKAPPEKKQHDDQS
jgi:predicted PurR-regulated permease PerM